MKHNTMLVPVSMTDIGFEVMGVGGRGIDLCM